MLKTGVKNMSQAQISQTQTEKVFLVWQKDTWGNHGQHHNVYTFVLVGNEWVPIFKLVAVKHENRDSRKNIHRYTYTTQSELKKLAGRVVKQVHDYASSRKREVTVTYYIVSESGELVKLEYEAGLRDARGWYDKIYLPGGKVLIARRDGVEVEGQ
jgi:hypothetical protein